MTRKLSEVRPDLDATTLASLDAIDLATAILYRSAQPPRRASLLFTTHDTQLARSPAVTALTEKANRGEAGDVMKQGTVEELELHLRERLDDVRNGESVQVIDGKGVIGTITPAAKCTIAGSRKLADEAVRMLIEEREHERSGKKYGL